MSDAPPVPVAVERPPTPQLTSAGDEDPEMPPLELPSVHEPHHAVYFTMNNKLHHVAMPIPKARSDDGGGDDEGGEVAEAEAAAEAEKVDPETEKQEAEDDNVLAKYLMLNYNRCENQLKFLLADQADGAPSQLHNAIETLHKMEVKSGDTHALSFAYCKRRFDRTPEEAAPAADGTEAQLWHTLEFHNMLDSAKIRMFNEETLALYREMDPFNTNVRLLVLENPFVCKELKIIVWQRMFVFVAPYSRHTERSAQAAEREKLHDKSIVVAHIMWGFVAFETVPAGNDLVDPKTNPDAATKSAERLHEMQAKYLQQRYEMRRKLIRRNIPVIDCFLRMFFCKMLTERMESAFPHIPERAVLHLPIEKCGLVLDTEKHIFEGHSTLVKLVAETQKEIAEKNALHKKEPSDQLAKELLFLDTTLHRTLSMLRAVKSIDPETQLLLHLKERGSYQDRGEDIELFYVLNINYDKLRVHRERTAELVAKEAALLEKKEEAPAAAAQKEGEVVETEKTQ